MNATNFVFELADGLGINVNASYFKFLFGIHFCGDSILTSSVNLQWPIVIINLPNSNFCLFILGKILNFDAGELEKVSRNQNRKFNLTKSRKDLPNTNPHKKIILNQD